MMEICDMHAHLLPGIDDGSGSWETTLEMIRLSYESGVREIIATPHNLPWKKGNHADQVPYLCREAEKKAKNILDISIRIFPGQEIYYHRETLSDLECGRALTLAGSRYVLIEFDESAPFETVRFASDQLARGGYIPVIAHFERFLCLRKAERIRELKAIGAMIQSNVHAPAHFGRFSTDRRWILRQYKAGIVDFVSSDMHNITSRPPIQRKDLEWFQKQIPESYLRKIFGDNARKIFAD